MIVIGIYVALMALLVAASYGRLRRSISISLGRDFIAEPMSGLTPGDAARIERWGADLEAAGLVPAGDYRVVPHAPPEDGSERLCRMRFWMTADRRTTAYATLMIAVTKVQETTTATRTLQLSIASRATSGRIYETLWTPLPPVVPPEAQHSVVRMKASAKAMIDSHRARAQEPLEEIADPTQAVQTELRRELERQIAEGWLLAKGGNAVATARYTRRALRIALNPLTGEERSPMMNGFLFAALALMGLAGAWIAGTVAPAWTLAIWLAAVWIAADFVFPNTALFASPLIVLPATALAPAAWVPVMMAALASIFSRSTVMKWRSRRFVAADEDVQGIGFVRAVGLVFGATAGFAVFMFLREPRPDGPLQPLAALAVAGILCVTVGIFFVSFVLQWVPAVRNTPGYRLLVAGELGLTLVLAGTLGGTYFADQDQRITEERGAMLIDAIERRGTPPATLDELGIPIPRPRIGWKQREFHYSVRGTDWTLGYDGPGMRREWDRIRRRWITTPVSP